MYLVMKSWSCSMYILVFFEYSNSIVLSLAPRPTGPPAPRRPAARTILMRASAGGAPAPRQPAARTTASVLIARQSLERREEHRSRHAPHRDLDQHGPVHLDRVGDELAHLGGLLRAPAHGARPPRAPGGH